MSVQLGLGLNRRQGGFNPFTPTHLNPYLLFDTRTSMLGELESPTLDLDAAVPSSLDVITATRSGVATYTDINGTIQTADPNTVRVDYVQGEELTPTKFQNIPYTDFSTGWSLIDATQEATDTSSPSPSYNAIRVTAQNSIYGRIQDYIGISQDATISVYVKRDGVDTVFQISSQTYGSSSFNINESGVSIESDGGLGYDIQEHGDGWWRISASFTGVGYVQFRPDRELGTRSVLLAMPQVEEGTTASDFVPNTTGSPKFIASATYGPRVPMMLIEPSATNLITNIDLLNNTNFTGGDKAAGGGYKGQPSVIITQPNDYGSITEGIYTQDGVTYTFSFYAKLISGSPNNLWVRHGSSASGGDTTSFGNEITPEWQKFSYQFLGKSGGGTVFVGFRFFVAGGTGPTIEVAMPQVEVGTVATSFIPNPAPISDNLNSVTSIEADGSVGGYSVFHSEAISGLSGKTVRVSFEVYDYEAGRFRAFAGNSGSAPVSIPSSDSEDPAQANGIYSRVVTADADQIIFRNQNGTENFKGKIRNISVVEVDTSGVRNADDLVLRDRTNLVNYSEDFSNSYWNKNDVTISPAPVAAPDGTMTASHVVATGPNGYVVAPNEVTANTHTISIWARTVSGSGTCYFHHSSGTPVTVTEEWQRFEVIANNNNVYAVDFRNAATLDEIYIWGAQAELGTTATRYIPTSGQSSVTQADFSDFYNATEGTWYCEVVPKGNDGSATYTFILEYGVDNNDRVGFFYYPSDGHQSITGFSSGSTFYNQDAYGDATNQLTRMSYSYKSGNHKSAINGTSASDTDAVVVSANQLFLGRRIHSGNNGKLIGHIKRLIYWPTHSDSL